MLIVDIQDVRITQIPDAHSPSGEISILYYLNDVYILLKQFPERGLDLAKSFYQKTIDERGWECLILDWEQNYSLWVSRSTVASSTQNPLSTVFGAQPRDLSFYGGSPARIIRASDPGWNPQYWLPAGITPNYGDSSARATKIFTKISAQRLSAPNYLPKPVGDCLPVSG
jgi:hypothetical protein